MDWLSSRSYTMKIFLITLTIGERKKERAKRIMIRSVDLTNQSVIHGSRKRNNILCRSEKRSSRAYYWIRYFNTRDKQESIISGRTRDIPEVACFYLNYDNVWHCGTTEETTVNVNDLDAFALSKLLENYPAVFSLGRLFEEIDYNSAYENQHHNKRMSHDLFSIRCRRQDIERPIVLGFRIAATLHKKIHR